MPEIHDLHAVTHIEKGLVVIEHFDDPALHGFAPQAEPVKPDDAPPVMPKDSGPKEGGHQ
ncbi:MAG: hypothetical protein ACREX4_25375 [Gammaproteobacteria bacterium]